MRFYCDCCDKYLAHDSYKGRKQHSTGRDHKDCWIRYYEQFLKDPELLALAQATLEVQNRVISEAKGVAPMPMQPVPGAAPANPFPPGAAPPGLPPMGGMAPMGPPPPGLPPMAPPGGMPPGMPPAPRQ